MAAHASVLHEARQMTEAEYLASDFEIDPDFVDGRIEERDMGGIEHTNWQRALMLWFLLDRGFQPLIASTEVTIRVTEGRIRIADLAVFTKPPQGAVVSDPPLAVIEILSPSDTFRRLKSRLRDYQKMGVRNLFVVENRTEISQFRDDQIVPVTNRSLLEGTDGFIDWKEAARLLWPNDSA